MRILLKRQVPINARAASPFGRDNRKHPPREERVAHLEVRAFQVQLRPPAYASETQGLVTNVVWIKEHSPPDNQPPVEWILYTREPIKTRADVEAIVDAYRARWLIEEYFKAIKTGCQYEKRQLESYAALSIALALFVPIAVKLLELRYLARTQPDQPATRLFSRRQLEILRVLRPEQAYKGLPSVTEVLHAVAGLGGHLKNNGYPGWLVLRRGMEKLLQAEVVWAAARGEKM
jgi:hypothetical protein